MGKENLIEILNTIEGFKIRFKEAHWNCIPKNVNVHKILDDAYDMIHSFEDSFAEEGITIFGKFEPGTLIANTNAVSITNDSKTLCKELLQFAYSIKESTKDDIVLCGLSAKVDVFISDIYNKIYLLNFHY